MRFDSGQRGFIPRACCAALFFSFGCQTMGSEGASGSSFGGPGFNGSGGSATIGSGTAAIDVDTRPVVKAARLPPPIVGGTLLALSDSKHALVSDPDRDRVWLVDYTQGEVTASLTLEEGAFPTRAVEDRAGHAYVLLRGSGEVLTVNLSDGSAGERRSVCRTPRGIALAPTGDKLSIACAEGKLIELGLSGGARTESPTLLDARDVVFVKDRVYVSRFRSSELLELDAARALRTRTSFPSVSGTLNNPLTGSTEGLFDPAVAWRAVSGPNGNSVVVVHQRATANPIVLPSPSDESGNGSPEPSIGKGGSAYGGDFSGCGGIVQSAVSVVQDGTVVTSPQLAGVVLPVDVAVSQDGFIAVASAGTADVNPAGFRGSAASSGQSLVVLSASDLDRTTVGDCLQTGSSGFEQPFVAVAFEPGPSGRVLALGRQPLKVYVVEGFRNRFLNQVSAVTLAGENVQDTGHEIFHRDSGGGIACASCHPEGTDDGRTWNFSPTGMRRTQPIDVGLADTAPFHWDGDLENMGKLMGEVFVRRMGGPSESPARVSAVEDWVFSLKPRAALRAQSDVAAERGFAIFNSAEASCTTCHSGPKFTNNTTVDVGTGGRFQVPSLLGVGQRVPLMHSGCAQTLRDRFDASCGGTAHGHTSQLDEGQLADLVAYLESI